jgi:hypothetical protein
MSSEKKLKIGYSQGSGFFSYCSLILHTLVDYFNKEHELPRLLDTSQIFHWYKLPHQENLDIMNEYFIKYDEGPLSNFNIKWETYVNYHHIHQYENYKNLDFGNLNNFIVKFFSPSDIILRYINTIEEKYIKNKYYYENICVLFYRGNDKSGETKLCSYDQFIEKGREILFQNPNVTFLIQSDETEFIETMQREFPNSFYFKDEIRHMHKNNSTVDHVFSHLNNEFSKYYLAITMIMGKCKYIICTSGNCSIWIILFRMHTNNVMQFLHDKWI